LIEKRVGEGVLRVEACQRGVPESGAPSATLRPVDAGAVSSGLIDFIDWPGGWFRSAGWRGEGLRGERALWGCVHEWR
jgi:hypothetical protein